ncbi:MAG: MFS transporter [Coriobacteriaceae bacterium]|nr:MFS transporter [Coriobacteriaceae bacterium]
MNRRSDSIWSPTYTLLIVVNFFQSMAAQIANTAIPLYARSLGITTASIGVIVASFTITAIAIRPFSGPAFDSFPKKTLFLGACLINMIAMVLYSFAASTETLFAVRLLHGVGIGCAAPLGMAICNQVLPPSRISSGISIYMLAFTVAQAIGPAFAVWFTQSVSYQSTFIISGCLLC